MQDTDLTDIPDLADMADHDTIIETDAARRVRVAREEAIISKAEADIDAGLGIEDDDLEVWLDELDRDPDARLPSPRKGSAVR